MPGNTFGKLFRMTTFGESHGKALGVVIDGCPAGLELDLELVQREMARRRPGQSKLVSPRNEKDEFEILSGVFEGKTTGTPIAMVVFNQDVRSKDYSEIKDLFRPGHADFTYFAKYGHRDYRGGGRSSARETAARVLAGSVARQILEKFGVSVRGGIVQVGQVKATSYDWDSVENNDVRCVDPAAVEAMTTEIESARKARDSVGGVVEVQALGVEPGLGEPVFDRLDAVLASALMSIPAVKAVEIGAGVSCASMKGSEMNDLMTSEGFSSNNHGGVLGGISSGAPVTARISIKPTSSLPQDQETLDVNFMPTKIKTLGRHDPCVAIRAVPIAEAMLSLVLCDFLLQQKAATAVREAFSPHTAVKYGLKDGSSS